MDKVPVAVIILTFNEAANIRFCLESIKDFTDEIFIVDSYSTDETLDIAREYTGRIFQNQWTHYAGQRQWALVNLPCSHDWIFFLDADEQLTLALKKEIGRVVQQELRKPTHGGFYVPRRFFFLGRPIRYGSCKGGCRELRLGHRGYLIIGERAGHELYLSQLPVGHLQEPMIHRDHKPLSAWIERHNAYATFNAEYLWSLKTAETGAPPNVCQDTADSRLYWKEKVREYLWHKLPLGFRPFLMFSLNYIFRFGFLDGMGGFLYAFLRDFWYLLLIDAKYLELKDKARKE